MKHPLLLVASHMLIAGVAFWVGTTMPGTVKITLSGYQGYVCGYVDGQLSILRQLPDNTLPAALVDREACPGNKS